jgi:hypothetical protein
MTIYRGAYLVPRKERNRERRPASDQLEGDDPKRPGIKALLSQNFSFLQHERTRRFWRRVRDRDAQLRALADPHRGAEVNDGPPSLARQPHDIRGFQVPVNEARCMQVAKSRRHVSNHL